MTFEYRVALTVWDGTQSTVEDPDTDAATFATPEEAEEVAAGYRSRSAWWLDRFADLGNDNTGAMEKLRAATYTVQRRTVGPWIDVMP